MKRYTNAKYPDKINDLIDNEGNINTEIAPSAKEAQEIWDELDIKASLVGGKVPVEELPKEQIEEMSREVSKTTIENFIVPKDTRSIELLECLDKENSNYEIDYIEDDDNYQVTLNFSINKIKSDTIISFNRNTLGDILQFLGWLEEDKITLEILDKTFLLIINVIFSNKYIIDYLGGVTLFNDQQYKLFADRFVSIDYMPYLTSGGISFSRISNKFTFGIAVEHVEPPEDPTTGGYYLSTVLNVSPYILGNTMYLSILNPHV